MSKLKKIAVIGNGKVGCFFAQALIKAGLSISHYARTPRTAEQKALSLYAAREELSLLCVSDESIAPLSEALPVGSGIIAHVSGATPLESLAAKHHRRAIFYPLMSLQAGYELPLARIPFCLEADQESDLQRLGLFAERLGAAHYPLNSKQRAYLHLAAVLAHNFSNQLYHLAYRVLQEQELSFALLKPLLLAQVEGLDDQDPALGQTGPALRGDRATMARHLSLLPRAADQDLYRLLSESISHTHEEEL